MNGELPKRLHHYTDLRGLRGIIEQQHLRMTSVFWMDDTTEVFWFYEVVLRVLGREVSGERNVLRARFENMMKDRQLSNIFSTSFSEVSDSRSQWLEYADDGHGFAIGFDPQTFDLKRVGPKRDVELKPAIYNEEEQKRMAEEIIRFVQEHGDELHDKFVLGAANYNAWRQAPRCKNPAFVNEKEWRLIDRNDPGDELNFRERARRHLIPFVKFPFDLAKKPIREIWLGPRNQSQRNVDAVAQLLRRCGYGPADVTFRASRIPLRAEY